MSASEHAERHAERIIGARRNLRAHPQVDGEGIQLYVDLDVMFMEAGIGLEEADRLTDDGVRARLGRSETAA